MEHLREHADMLKVNHPETLSGSVDEEVALADVEMVDE